MIKANAMNQLIKSIKVDLTGLERGFLENYANDGDVMDARRKESKKLK